MKIVQVLATSGGVGGLEQHTFNLVNELALNHEVHVIAHPCYVDKFSQQVHFYAIDFARSRWNIFLLWQLKNLIQQIQPAIVHAQAGKAAELIARIKPFLSGPKFVTTVHGTKKNKSAYLAGDAVIAVSQALTQGIPESKAHVVYNGVYPQPVLTTENKEKLLQSIQKDFTELDTSKKVVICIGRLEPVKNISLLIDSMQQIDANLWIVGDGSLRASLEKQVSELNMQNRVAFLGFRTDARDLVQLADVVVLSSDREGFPLVMVEALQADKAMASTKVNGVIEWLPEQYLAEIGDTQGLAKAIEYALQSEAQNDFSPLYAKAKAELTVPAMAEQTLNIYKGLLKT
ncbi:glycosyltransferase [Acinetobacter nosocomialis]|uniref:glycosyltransferase n=1 Tax=Acinetobacter calcoaceticus/baumannii complex TaxID=909768 RepID=UPI0027408C73|nr:MULTISPECIES: glycosyltransferase [Acinetobacter calcoaceticus/baumannii complex]MDP7773934.1 glycosyltransferase [Acinetobacter nosocomialis]MDQ8912103.1 glycosyltransferase [Acinetobacter baumannii]